MIKRLAVAALAATLSGCAVAPASIAPAYVSEVPYQSYSCKQLGEEAQRLNDAYTVAAKQQENARTGDTWGVILLGLPTSSLSGGNIAPQIASLKGQQEAVQKVIIAKNCRA
ncbi:MAG TPA: hypothetical protein VGM83_18910 [Devosiaceae bacterium]|jgi:hypothetical protein